MKLGPNVQEVIKKAVADYYAENNTVGGPEIAAAVTNKILAALGSGIARGRRLGQKCPRKQTADDAVVPPAGTGPISESVGTPTNAPAPAPAVEGACSCTAAGEACAGCGTQNPV